MNKSLKVGEWILLRQDGKYVSLVEILCLKHPNNSEFYGVIIHNAIKQYAVAKDVPDMHHMGNDEVLKQRNFEVIKTTSKAKVLFGDTDEEI